MSIASIEHARTFLYVPGDAPRKLETAIRSNADAVVADLEDAVAPAAKETARETVARFARERDGGPTLLVRVNGLASGLFERDLDAVSALPVSGIVLPKAHAGDIDGLDLAGMPLVAMIEDARGVREAYELAGSAGVVRLGLGGVDLTAELGLRPYTDGLQLLFARSRLVIDSAAAGLAAPIDTPFLQFDDDAGLRREAELARSLGFGGKACIHPAQIETVAAAFSPSADEVAWAAEIVEVFESAANSGLGVVSHRGAMVDAPVLARARALLAQATYQEGE